MVYFVGLVSACPLITIANRERWLATASLPGHLGAHHNSANRLSPK